MEKPRGGGNNKEKQNHGQIGNDTTPKCAPVSTGIVFTPQQGRVQDGVAGSDHGAFSSGIENRGAISF
jgi:hypothetical protein